MTLENFDNLIVLLTDGLISIDPFKLGIKSTNRNEIKYLPFTKNALRQHLTDDVRIHGIITSGGDAPNIVPEYAEAKFYLRAKTKKTVSEIRSKVEKIVEGAGFQTGAKGSIESYQNIVDDTITTPLLDEIYFKNFEKYDSDIDYSERSGAGSTDVGNVSYVVPTIQPYFKISKTPVVGHSADFREASCSEFGLEAMRNSSYALACTALDLILEEALLDKVKKQHKEQLSKVE